MTIVLVHGNPETDALWGPLVDALGRTDVVRLSPPGFGAPLGEGFSATYLAYRDWLEAQHWNKKPPAPHLPPEILARTSDNYREALKLLTA